MQGQQPRWHPTVCSGWVLNALEAPRLHSSSTRLTTLPFWLLLPSWKPVCLLSEGQCGTSRGGGGSRGNRTQRQLCKLTLGGSTLIEGSAGAKRSLLDVTAKNSEHLLIPFFIGNPGSPLVIYILLAYLMRQIVS